MLNVPRVAPGENRNVLWRFPFSTVLPFIVASNLLPRLLPVCFVRS